MKFRVNRNRWRTGGFGPKFYGSGNTQLCNGLGWMCCLGHCMISEGFNENEIVGFYSPLDVKNKNSILNKTPLLITKAISINDNLTDERDEIEEKLKILFQSYGYEIEFYDGEGP